MNATTSVNSANQYDPTPEAQLLAGMRAGDDRAYEALVRRYSGRLLAVARRFLGCDVDAADAVQEAFISAFRAIDRFDAHSAFGTWLHRIVVNACLMKLRSRARRRTVSIEELLPTFDDTGHHVRPVLSWTDDALASLSKAEMRARVRACIDELPDDSRTILLLRDIDELDTEQAAELLGISVPAVKTRLHRARQALRTLLEPLALEIGAVR
jgi:RNA polymerase sigma-70 factor (ECF subfamily)